MEAGTDDFNTSHPFEGPEKLLEFGLRHHLQMCLLQSMGSMGFAR